MNDAKITIRKPNFRLRGPLVTATHVEVVYKGELKRLQSVRVASEAIKHKLTCLIGDPSYDKFAFIAYGTLYQLGLCFDDCQIISNNAEFIKLRVYGVKEKANANASTTARTC
ncbi:MAG: hypothetical protein RR280_08625 [Bacteroidaceae bacterium]